MELTGKAGGQAGGPFTHSQRGCGQTAVLQWISVSSSVKCQCWQYLFQGELSELIHIKLFRIMPGTWHALCLNLLLPYRRSSNFNMAYGFSTSRWRKSGMHSVENILGVWNIILFRASIYFVYKGKQPIYLRQFCTQTTILSSTFRSIFNIAWHIQHLILKQALCQMILPECRLMNVSQGGLRYARQNYDVW